MTQTPSTSRIRAGLCHLCALAVMAAVPLAGCAPIVFEDGNALVIAGDPPPPPPEPEAPKPKPKPKRVVVKDNKIEFNEPILFEVNKAIIREVSFSLLDEIVSVIKENPQIKKLSLEGHTSTEGSEKKNQRLSDKRAASVKKYLIEHGIAEEMLSSKGFGESRPLVPDEDDEEARKKNRRVEFLITEQDVTKKKVEIDPDTGEEKVVDEKTEKVQR